MKLSRFKVNNQAAEEGVWVDAGEGLRLLVARMSNKGAQDFIRRETRRNKRHSTGSIADAAMESATKRAIANHVLLGWENLLGDDEQQIPFSANKALEIFEEFPDFLTMVIEYATDIDLFRDETMEQSAGN